MTLFFLAHQLRLHHPIPPQILNRHVLAARSSQPITSASFSGQYAHLLAALRFPRLLLFKELDEYDELRVILWLEEGIVRSC
jgi:hypothetical protein